jgi:hypothetical protein
VVKNASRLTTVCNGFTDPDSGLKVTMKTKALSGIGDQAYLVTLTNPQWQVNGNVLVAVRVGDVVAPSPRIQGCGGRAGNPCNHTPPPGVCWD